MRTALLLIAHGSRQEEANADLQHVLVEMRRRGRYAIVEASYLELAEPGIEEGAARCVAQGAERVVLLPYFLSAGVHVCKDLGQVCRRLRGGYPGVDFRLAEPLGRHPLLLEVVAERARQAEQEDPGSNAPPHPNAPEGG
jgi:sirohydrochlorin ferrochelatase